MINMSENILPYKGLESFKFGDKIESVRLMLKEEKNSYFKIIVHSHFLKKIPIILLSVEVHQKQYRLKGNGHQMKMIFYLNGLLKMGQSVGQNVRNLFQVVMRSNAENIGIIV